MQRPDGLRRCPGHRWSWQVEAAPESRFPVQPTSHQVMLPLGPGGVLGILARPPLATSRMRCSDRRGLGSGAESAPKPSVCAWGFPDTGHGAGVGRGGQLVPQLPVSAHLLACARPTVVGSETPSRLNGLLWFTARVGPPPVLGALPPLSDPISKPLNQEAFFWRKERGEQESGGGLMMPPPRQTPWAWGVDGGPEGRV